MEKFEIPEPNSLDSLGDGSQEKEKTPKQKLIDTVKELSLDSKNLKDLKLSDLAEEKEREEEFKSYFNNKVTELIIKASESEKDVRSEIVYLDDYNTSKLDNFWIGVLFEKLANNKDQEGNLVAKRILGEYKLSISKTTSSSSSGGMTTYGSSPWVLKLDSYDDNPSKSISY